MKYLVVLFLLPFLLQSSDTKEGFFVKLKDGNLFLCNFVDKELKVKTDFGILTVSTNDIKWAKLAKDGFMINVGKSTIEGKIESELSLNTKHGKVLVKIDDIAEIMPPNKKVPFNDDNVVGYWDFNGEEELKTNGCEFVTEDEVNALKLDLSKGDYFEIPHKDEYSLKEQVTIEMRFKFKDLNGDGNYIPLIKKSDASGYMNYGVHYQPNGKNVQIGAHNENTSYPYISRQCDFGEGKWHYLITVLDAKNHKMDLYLDGKKLDASLQSGFIGDSFKTNESPLSVCKDKYRNGNTIWFDFIRISKKARTSDEIKELFESVSITSGLLKQSSDWEFNTAVVTKNGEWYLCKLDNEFVEVETSFGGVKIDAKKIHSILFFEYRKRQIQKMHDEAKNLVTKLGDGSVEVRDKAQDDLKKMGWVVLPVLEENKDNNDEEIKTRVKKILEGINKKFDVKKDIIECKGLSLRGWIKQNSFKATTRFGQVELKDDDLKAIIFNDPVMTTVLKDNTKLMGKLLQDEVSMSTNHGKIRIAFRDIKCITIEKDGDSITTKKSVIKGIIEQVEFEFESQIGKIKIKKESIGSIIFGVITQK